MFSYARSLFHKMPKRPAEEPLENVSETASTPKKARVDDEDEIDQPQPNGHSHGTRISRTNQASAQDTDDSEEEEDDEGSGEEDNEEDGDTAAVVRDTRQKAPTEGYSDLYLDTIDRKVLDFDFEKLCSVTLSNMNVYACLVCGKYFQGRGPKSQAYFHALDEDHHVYINLESKRVYVLPEGYEVQSRALDDIKFVVDPWLASAADVAALDNPAAPDNPAAKPAYDISGRKYTPGFVGLNNIKANDYFNVVMHLLAHVTPLRNFVMDPRNQEFLAQRPQLAQRFSALVRKLWNPRAFKAHVSPHELLQEIAARSDKRFALTHQADPAGFLAWFLNNLHLALGGSRTKPLSSVVQRALQGRMRVESQQITAKQAESSDRLRFEESAHVESVIRNFTILTLDLPPAPLFQDELDRNAIPQVPLSSLLAKYDGVRAQERLSARVRYRLMHPLPPFLLLHIKRFSATKFSASAERNPTIVTFSPRSLDLAPYVEPDPKSWPVGEPVWYDLVGNVTHEGVRVREDSVEGEAERRVWRAQVRRRAQGGWVELQDLFVEEAEEGRLATKESYIMVWERRDKGKAPGRK